jgi:hypothetical protein
LIHGFKCSDAEIDTFEAVDKKRQEEEQVEP